MDVDLLKNNSFNFWNWWCFEVFECECDLDLDYLGVDGVECVLYFLYDGNFVWCCNVVGDVFVFWFCLILYYENFYFFFVILVFVFI